MDAAALGGLASLAVNFTAMFLIFPSKLGTLVTTGILIVYTVAFTAVWVLTDILAAHGSGINGFLFIPIVFLFRGPMNQKIFAFLIQFYFVVSLTFFTRAAVSVVLPNESGLFNSVLAASFLVVFGVYAALLFKFGRSLFGRIFVATNTDAGTAYTVGSLFAFIGVLMSQFGHGIELSPLLYLLVRLYVFFGLFMLCFAIINTHENAAASVLAKNLEDENAALERLSRMKTEYLANISHETKTPLTIVSVHVQQAAELYEESGLGNKIIIDSLGKANEEILKLGKIAEENLRLAAKEGMDGNA